MAHTRAFPGGIHPKLPGRGKSATKSQPIRNAKAPARVVVALQQHIGEPCTPIVAPGDVVDMGQMIGRVEAGIGAPIHAPVSGRVVALDTCLLPNGRNAMAVVIDNDHAERWHPSCVPHENVDALTSDQLRAIVRDAGIVGLGGATFPTHIKLSPPEGKHIDTVILNGAECESYITVDHRTMLEDPHAVVDGLELVKRILGAERAIIGIEGNMVDVIPVVQGAAHGKVDVITLPVMYPQGGEKQLIYGVTGRVVPAGKLPMDVGTLVINVSTAAAISHAVREGKPLIDRVITISGRVRNPSNLRARIGTTLVDLFDECGGLLEGVEKVVLGGPMMGVALHRLDTGVTKGADGLIALGAEAVMPVESACIRCGRCVTDCPMQLIPNKIDAASRSSQWDAAERFGVRVCIECGICSYVCPAKRAVTQSCRTAKAALYARDAAPKQ